MSTSVKIISASILIIAMIAIGIVVSQRSQTSIDYHNGSINNILVNGFSPLSGPLSPPKNTAKPLRDPFFSPNLVSTKSCKDIYLGNKSRKEIALTFDAGSGKGSVDKILEKLAENNVYATFFITGKWAEQNTESVKKIAEAGHEIYNHTYSHPDLTKIVADEMRSELERTDKIISGLIKRSTKPYFRPPYGAIDKDVSESACLEGYQAIMWTVDALDWKEGTTAEVAKSRIYSKEQNGQIVLMHVGDDLSAEILSEVIAKLTDDGYKLVTLSQMNR